MINWTVDQFITSEVGITANTSRTLVQLFEDGYEIPFIARYRRHLTGDTTPDDLRHALEAYKKAVVIKAKSKKLIAQADARIEDRVLRDSVKIALSRTMDSDELDNIFEPFKKLKRSSLASRAAGLGIGQICSSLYRGEFVDLELFVGSKPELNTLANVETATIHLLSHELHCLEETQSLLQELIEMKGHLNIGLKVKSVLTKRAKALKETDSDFLLLDRYRLYINFEKDVQLIQPFQILALERASSKNIINWKVVVDDSITSIHPGLKLAFHPIHLDLLHKAVQHSTKRFLIPSIERRIRRKLLDRAENSAIDCFAKNLRQLLLTAPLKGYAVLAIDPGYSNGCKCALINERGLLIDTAVFYLVRVGAKRWDADEVAEKVLKTLALKAPRFRLLIAVGNGVGSRETQRFVASLIQRHIITAQFWIYSSAVKGMEHCNNPLLNPFVVAVIHKYQKAYFSIVSECGASVYSATKLAAEELPEVDIKLRSAVSLARRIIDPLSEYVKIAPKHLGVGVYQHSVNEKRLDVMLDIIVRECVSNVGVDVNVASHQVLQKVSGLNKTTAANIIKYRQHNGPITSREELKKISGIGPKCFEQCAGFLHVYSNCNNKSNEPLRKKAKLAAIFNPLDTTSVHPESYHIAEQILGFAGVDSSYIGHSSLPHLLVTVEQQVRERGPEWLMVWDLLSHPFVRRNAPILLTDLPQINSLKEGDVLDGIVRNHAQFGVFIDIGVGCDALAHSSTLPSLVPEVNSVVKVRIVRLQMDRRKIGVTII